ncbi:arabinosyltransferase domain-containing protein [Actinomycetospora cinnamomea]|uniref:EmbC-like arabinotransferase in arabinogalactan biosynthesis n=1 Tax=Actinomycetospora cinnamomea TaxID=663609 RepID=A0A2U1FBT6_9PSEU|nr:arabinosyltransferase domain-containing protein [Actinomycetospora cinnamomea]PVZ09589.1 EmbC-like arabinotransferase in arabinogalactan biosynthesis [Actinomycetospora cinnamomea]
MLVRPDQAPSSPDPGDVARTGGRRVLLWALLTVLLGIAVPLAPVTVQDTTVTWPDPAAAPGAPVSTQLALNPPRPLGFSATVPCAALRVPGDVLRTLPGDPAGGGLVLASAGSGASLTVSGATVAAGPVPAGDCRLAIVADEGGLRVTQDGVPLPLACGPCTDVLPPQVAQLTTSTDGTPASGGLAVSLRTDDRYDSTPGVLKTVLLVAHLAALAVLLVLVYRQGRWRGARAWLAPRAWPARLRRHLSWADGLLVAISAGWVFVAPMNFDDSWYPLMARDAGEAGYIGNAVYMFNVTENPFVASQYAMQAWGAIGGWGLVWQRCLPLLYGLLTWALLRAFFVLVSRRTEVRRAWVPWALLIGHLVWWLPFGLTLRPEPLIVLLSVVVLLLVELARDRGTPILYVGAVMAAALAIACSPTGLVAAAPLLVEIPRAWPAIVATPRRDQIALLLVLGAAASVAIPVAFADASLGDVVEASAVHAYYYDTVPWYDELVHYQTLLGPGRTPWAARAPILLTLALVLLVAVGSGRRGPEDDALRRVLLHAAATTALAFVLVAASPTKWVLHFPAIAASGTVLIALALLRGPMPRHDRALATVGGVAVLVIATSVSYAGWNLWRPYTDRGQFFGDHADPYPTPLSQNLLAPHFGPIFLRNPLLWVAVAVLAAVWAHWSLRRWPQRRLPRPEPDRALLAVAATTVVVGMIGVMVLAPLRQYPGWTVALGNVKDVVRQGCGLQDDVTVLRPDPVAFGAPVNPPVTTGDFVDDTVAPIPEPVPGLGRVWHDVTDGSGGRGTLVTGWYPVPAGTGATDVVVPLLESGPPDERVSVEFADGAAEAPRVLGRTEIDYLPQADERTWQQRPVSLVDAPGDPTFVRVVVDTTAERGQDRLAVAQPFLARPEPITPVVEGRPVLVDQMSTVLWPCVDQVASHDGIAPASDVRIHADEDLTSAYYGLQDRRERGGVWRLDTVGVTYVRLATAVPPGREAAKPWGRVDLVVRDLPTGRYGLSTTERSKSGWERGPTLARQEYVDVEPQGAVG